MAESKLDLPELFFPINTLKLSISSIVASFTLRKFIMLTAISFINSSPDPDQALTGFLFDGFCARRSSRSRVERAIRARPRHRHHLAGASRQATGEAALG